MKKKFEEELAKLAFGELNADEAQRLELQALKDPEATRAFDSYCRMKTELRSLAVDVPDDQLSTDRLRQAILARGLGERKAAQRFGWVWMPVTAAALAFGFMVLKAQLSVGGAGATMVVDQSTKAPDLDVPRILAPEPPSMTAAIPKSQRNSVISEVPSRVVAMNSGQPSRSRRGQASLESRSRGGELSLPGGVDQLTFATPTPSEGMMMASKPVDFGGREEESTLPGAPSSPAASTTILVIQPETDSNTGTHRATEVNSTVNVIVGG